MENHRCVFIIFPNCLYPDVFVVLGLCVFDRVRHNNLCCHGRTQLTRKKR